MKTVKFKGNLRQPSSGGGGNIGFIGFGRGGDDDADDNFQKLKARYIAAVKRVGLERFWSAFKNHESDPGFKTIHHVMRVIDSEGELEYQEPSHVEFLAAMALIDVVEAEAGPQDIQSIEKRKKAIIGVLYKVIVPFVSRKFRPISLRKFQNTFKFEDGYVAALDPQILKGLAGFSRGAYHDTPAKSGKSVEAVEKEIQTACENALQKAFGRSMKDLGVYVAIRNFSGHTSLIISLQGMKKMKNPVKGKFIEPIKRHVIDWGMEDDELVWVEVPKPYNTWLHRLSRAGAEIYSVPADRATKDTYTIIYKPPQKWKKLKAGKTKVRKKRNPIADTDVQKCLHALAILDRQPNLSEMFDEKILDALESEGLWNIDKGVTEKGKQFLRSAGHEDADEFYD